MNALNPATSYGLSPPQIIFLRAFIGTSQPLQHFAAGGVVIPFPYAFPEEVDALLRIVRKPRNKLRDLPRLLPAPAIAGLLPARVETGRSVTLPGLSHKATIERTFTRWGETWRNAGLPWGRTGW